MDQQGDFVVVWQSSSGYSYYEKSHHWLRGRRYHRTGMPAGGQFQLTSSYDYGSHTIDPTVAMNASGAFVVVWYESNGGGLEVRGQIFDRSGRRQSGTFRANETKFNHFWRGPAVAMAEDGSFVVIWDYPSSPTLTSQLGITGARFSAAGARLGNEIEVVAADDGRMGPAAVASARAIDRSSSFGPMPSVGCSDAAMTAAVTRSATSSSSATVVRTRSAYLRQQFRPTDLSSWPGPATVSPKPVCSDSTSTPPASGIGAELEVAGLERALP